VVTKDVKPYALIVGNPGKQVGWMSEFGHRLQFDEKGIGICPESNEKYQLINGNVKKIS
jgi:UDP-2-acetamido-3-amino-2,3-dideoxy-glucuronate N-acetyltransferase